MAGEKDVSLLKWALIDCFPNWERLVGGGGELQWAFLNNCSRDGQNQGWLIQVLPVRSKVDLVIVNWQQNRYVYLTS